MATHSSQLPLRLSILLFFILFTSSTLLCSLPNSAAEAARDGDPTPAPWPHQFHAFLFMNNSGSLTFVDLWYDWPNGRNFNIIRNQLDGSLLYDLEWNNGTSFYYRLDSTRECRTLHFEVGILHPNWLDGANYLGQRNASGFLCNVWEKVDFIWYYEDVITKRPVQWFFYTGQEAYVMTYEVGAALEDSKWQAPSYCFEKDDAAGRPNLELAITRNSHEGLRDGVLRGSMGL